MIKSINLTVKDLSLQSREAVLAHATYKSLDREEDRANRGMFDKSWKEKWNDLRYFLNHDRKQAPGKPIRAWDDEDHAYTQVKHGTHTLGEDVLKMLDEGVIVAVSCGFVPVKQKKIANKGYDFFEAHHLETSALTHWPAHEQSSVMGVQKALDKKEQDQIAVTLRRMEKFIRDTTASDEAISSITKEFQRLKQLLIKNTDTAESTDPVLIECQKCHTMSSGIEDFQGRIKCAECDNILTKSGQQGASSDKEAFKRRLLLLKTLMQ